MTPVILIGRGGHALSCLDVLQSTGSYTVVGVVDAQGRLGEVWQGLTLLGTDEDLPALLKNTPHVVLGIGQIESSGLRKELVGKLRKAGALFPTVVSPKAHVSPRAVLAEGTVVMPGAHVGPDARIGAFNILNTASVTEHGVRTGAHVHVSTAAVVNGDCVLGEDVFIGSNAVLRHGVSVPAGAFIQAGTFIGGKHVW